MTLKMKKIVATVTALALSLTGAITLGITSNAANQQPIENFEFTIPTIVDGQTYSGRDLMSTEYTNPDNVVSIEIIQLVDEDDKEVIGYSTLDVQEPEEGTQVELAPTDGQNPSYYTYRKQLTIKKGHRYILAYNFKINNENSTSGTTYYFSNNLQLTEKNNTSIITQFSSTGGVELAVVSSLNIASAPASNVTAPAQETPVVDAPAVEPAVEAAPVETVAEPTPEATEETPAPAETVKAKNTAPKTGDTLPIVPFVLMGLVVVAGSVVVLQKRYF